MDFSYTIFPIKKNKCWKNFKIMRNCYLNIFSIHILKLKISGCDKRELKEVTKEKCKAVEATAQFNTAATGRANPYPF
jgi:hypothetical protein